MNTVKIFNEKDDKKFYLEIPDPNFSPDRNKAIIDMTIKKYEANRKKKLQELNDPYRERSDAVVSFLKTAEQKPGYDINRFFGRKMLAYLRGDEIRQKLMAGMTILDKNGKKVTKNFI